MQFYGLFAVVILASSLATIDASHHQDTWGENLMPRLRVNYLSQKTGKI